MREPRPSLNVNSGKAVVSVLRSSSTCVVVRGGMVSALFGIVFAAVQTDMKRLLAYSSIENIGLIMSGFGLTLLLTYNDVVRSPW